MKILFSIIHLLAVAHVALGQQSVMTYNIRYDNPGDELNQWQLRKEEVVSMIRYYQPDLLGIQEGLHHQVAYLDSALIDYSYIGVGRDDGKTQGEYAAIFYKTSRMKAMETETYWLSDTPNRVSVGWDASMERVTTYGWFVDVITGDSVHIFNAHFDHRGEEARLNSARLILDLIEEKALSNKKLMVMGDFNCLPDDAPMQVFKSKLLDPMNQRGVIAYGPVGTSNGFDTRRVMIRRIDYILIQNIKTQSYRHIDDRRKNNLHLSDHLPVLLEIVHE